MDKTTALQTLIDLTNKKHGRQPSSPTEFDDLCRQIKKELGRTISVSSIKRIWGYVPYDGFPTTTTLNILAEFNGLPGWSHLLACSSAEELNESCFLLNSTIDTAKLRDGAQLDIRWSSNKRCIIECIDRKKFRVLQSTNIKLLPGDTFTLHTLSVGLPIYATAVYRGSEMIGDYTGAKNGGVTIINNLLP